QAKSEVEQRLDRGGIVHVRAQPPLVPAGRQFPTPPLTFAETHRGIRGRRANQDTNQRRSLLTEERHLDSSMSVPVASSVASVRPVSPLINSGISVFVS